MFSRFRRASREWKLAGRAIFISGGSRGLGLELGREFGRRGARVAFCGRDAAEVERARADLAGRGIDVAAYAADVTDCDAVKRMLEAVSARFGSIEVIVNNAGIINVGPRDDMTVDDYRRAMETHFWGPFYIIEALLPAMRARRNGRIVNVCSIGGRISVPHLLPYSASKFALVGYSEGLRAELLRERVYVTTVVPGLMRTGSPENAEFKGQHRKEYAWFSISDSLPLASVDVSVAARAIVDATERGDADLTISLPAKIGSIVHGIFPGFVADTLGLVARFLPGSGGIGRQSLGGRDAHSALSPSLLTVSTQHRAVTQNELAS